MKNQLTDLISQRQIVLSRGIGQKTFEVFYNKMTKVFTINEENSNREDWNIDFQNPGNEREKLKEIKDRFLAAEKLFNFYMERMKGKQIVYWDIYIDVYAIVSGENSFIWSIRPNGCGTDIWKLQHNFYEKTSDGYWVVIIKGSELKTYEINLSTLEAMFDNRANLIPGKFCQKCGYLLFLDRTDPFQKMIYCTNCYSPNAHIQKG